MSDSTRCNGSDDDGQCWCTIPFPTLTGSDGEVVLMKDDEGNVVKDEKGRLLCRCGHPVSWHPTGSAQATYEKRLDELCQEFHNLKLQIGKEPPGVIARVQWVNTLRMHDMLNHSPALDTFLSDHRVTWWVNETEKGKSMDNYFPNVNAREDKEGGTQEFVSQILSKHFSGGSSKLSMHFPPKYAFFTFQPKDYFCKGTKDVQQMLRCFYDKSDTHNCPSIGNRKPDNVFRFPANSTGEHSIVIIGDNKRRDQGDFADEEIGHLLDMTQHLLSHFQKKRHFMYSFLSDGYRFQFFKALRIGDKFTYEYSNVYLGFSGWQSLFGLLCQPHDDLGFKEYRVDGWQLCAVFGSGRFATAFRAKKQNETTGEEYVLKLFDSSDKAECENEYLTLRKLRDEGGVIAIPKPGEWQQDGSQRFLVVSPVGREVLPMWGGCWTDGRQFRVLVDVLEQAHRLGIAHRDVKPDNIFLGGEEGIILSDWGSSCQIGERTMFVGSMPFCVDGPDINGMHSPSAETDLKCLVRSVYAMLTTRYPPLNGYEDYWNKRFFVGSIWSAALEDASNKNYIDLRAKLSQL